MNRRAPINWQGPTTQLALLTPGSSTVALHRRRLRRPPRRDARERVYAVRGTAALALTSLRERSVALSSAATNCVTTKYCTARLPSRYCTTPQANHG